MCPRRYRLFASAVLLVAAFNLTFRLGQEVVTEWDESLYATSAWEMVQSDQWLIPTFHGAVDYYNSKPPLNIWLIALSLKLFGSSLVALRIVSALAAWLTVLVLMRWTRLQFGDRESLLAGLVLSTTYAFIYVHAGRSANPDSLLTLFIVLTIATLSRTRGNPWQRLWLGPLAAGVFMLKGMAVLLPLAIVLTTELLPPRRRSIRSQPAVGAVLLFIVPVAAWAVARWRVDQWTFLGRLVAYDFVAQMLSPLEEHAGSVLYYPNILQMYHYDWLAAGLVAALVVWRGRSQMAGRDVWTLPGRSSFRLLCVWATLTLLVPTVMQTKLPWYLNPFYPALAVGIACLCTLALRISRTGLRSGPAHRLVAVAIMLAFGVAEGRLVWNSFARRDLNGSAQGVIKGQAGQLAGRRVYSAEWSRSEQFVAHALAGAEPIYVNDVETFWRESRAGDYLFARQEQADDRLARVAVNSRAGLYYRLR